MKKLLLLITVISMAFVGCEPMDDIYEDIDTSLKVEGSADLTLSEDDYADLELDDERFMNLDEAKALIPGLLEKKYPAFTENSLATVTFNLFDPVVPVEYTVTSADYAEAGLDGDYFTSEAAIYDFLETKYVQEKNGFHVDLTYNILADEIVFTLEYADYSVIQEELGDTYPDATSNAAKYGSFTVDSGSSNYWSEDMIIEALGAFISVEYGDVKGQKYNVTYEVYNGTYTDDQSMTVQFDGNNYVAVGGTAYELVDADYDMIISALSSTYPLATENMANYGNFERRDYKDSYWSDAMVVEALNLVLDAQFPAAVEGDQFFVTYAKYDGSSDRVGTMALIKSGDSFIVDESASVSTIQTSSVFALTNDTWSKPLELPENIYTEEFEQRYNNFGDEEDVAFYIGRYLEPLYPYAQDGDMISVAFDFYDGGLETRYGVFTYMDREWIYTPRTVETTLQFGFDGTAWVPDNTIQYSFTAEDYALVATELADVYTAQAENLEGYGNFNRSGGSTSWNDDMMLAAFNVLLNNIAPSAEIGQKYALSYVIYAGGYSTETKTVIKVDENTWAYYN